MRAIRRFRSDEDGAILVFVAIALAVLLGMVALSFDMGRVASTQSELQSFADSVALAAAGELDGKADSIARAQAAAAAMIADTQTFATGGRALDVNDVTLTFLSALDADDVPPFADTITAVPGDAAFVRVDVRPHDVRMGFASAFGRLSGQAVANAGVGATAVAGFTQYACQVTPLMFCLPEPGYSADAHIGDMIILRSSRQNAAWQPGNFGFLDPTTTALPNPNGACGGRLNGRNLYSCLVGAAGPVTQCYAIRGVDMEPGQRVGISEAFNVRFDLYEATMGGERNDIDYAPAPNTIKGIANIRRGNGNGQCDMTTSQTVAVPRDDCMATNTCPGVQPAGGHRFGDGVWTQGRRNYIEANYGDGNLATVEADPHPAARTRYEFYLAEIAAMASGRILPSGEVESGVAQCHRNPSTDPDRRVIVAAGIDCSTTTFSGRATGVPVEEFFEIFLTEPSTNDHSVSPPDISIVGEIVGSAGGAGSTPDGTFHDVVQLYR